MKTEERSIAEPLSPLPSPALVLPEQPSTRETSFASVMDKIQSSGADERARIRDGSASDSDESRQIVPGRSQNSQSARPSFLSGPKPPHSPGSKTASPAILVKSARGVENAESTSTQKASKRSTEAHAKDTSLSGVERIPDARSATPVSFLGLSSSELVNAAVPSTGLPENRALSLTLEGGTLDAISSQLPGNPSSTSARAGKSSSLADGATKLADDPADPRPIVSRGSQSARAVENAESPPTQRAPERLAERGKKTALPENLALPLAVDAGAPDAINSQPPGNLNSTSEAPGKSSAPADAGSTKQAQEALPGLRAMDSSAAMDLEKPASDASKDALLENSHDKKASSQKLEKPGRGSSTDGGQGSFQLEQVKASIKGALDETQLTLERTIPLRVSEIAVSKHSADASRDQKLTPAGDGTLAAQASDMGKTDSKMNKTAWRPEQKLPLASVSRLEPVETTLSIKDVSTKAEASMSWPPFSGQDQFESSLARVAQPGSGRDVVATEEIASQISKQAIALKHFNADSMAVVLKPDSQTAIFLHLRLEQGQVQIHARFESGNYEALSSGWVNIQQSLSQHGIRLGALQAPISNGDAAPSSFGRFNQPNGQRDFRQENPEVAPSKAPAPAVASGKKALTNNSVKSTAADRRRWETWA